MLWHPDPPQGFSKAQGQVIIGRPIIPLIGAPQGDDESGVVVSENPLLALYPPQADLSYDFYKFYQIKKNQVPTTQTDMPLVIIDTLPTGSLQQASGFDIRVFDSAGSPLPYEVQFVDVVSCDIIVWVNMTTVKESEFVQLTFGKESATDGSTPNTVYDVNYCAVYHMNQTVFGVDSILDSTINDNKGSTSGSPTSVNGKIGKAYRTNGVSNSVTIPNSPSLEFCVDNFTIEAWIENFETASNFFGVIEKKLTFNENNTGFMFWNDFRAADTGLVMRLNNGTHLQDNNLDYGFDATSILRNNGLHKIEAVYTKVNKTLTLYIDNVPGGSMVYTFSPSDFTNTEPLIFGGENSPDITLDEIKLSNIARSIDYRTTTFNNQNDNDSFWFKTRTLKIGKDNFLEDDQLRNIVAVEQ